VFPPTRSYPHLVSYETTLAIGNERCVDTFATFFQSKLSIAGGGIIIFSIEANRLSTLRLVASPRKVRSSLSKFAGEIKSIHTPFCSQGAAALCNPDTFFPLASLRQTLPFILPKRLMSAVNERPLDLEPAPRSTKDGGSARGGAGRFF